MGARENILSRIRAAQGKGDAPSPGERETVAAYLEAHLQGPRPESQWDPVARFRERARKLATTLDEAPALAAVPRVIAKYLRASDLPLEAVCWREFADLDWHAAGIGVEARAATGGDMVGITGCCCAIAETGTLITLSGTDTPASVSLLPETHIAIVRAGRIVKGMEDAWALLRAECGALPRAVNFISGPSRTADIEQTVTLGAHGPYRVHVILVSG